MKRGLWISAAGVAAFVLFVFLNNTSLLARHANRRPVLLAHRGLSQTFSHANLNIYTGCTANRIYPPTHAYLENTIASMAKSYALGADIIELDIHPTTDGQFAVFHDWGVDCRTNGHGTTREHSMKYLKTLDIGYGYTADGGKTFPFRGKFVGQMPSLDEVIAHFPGKGILINVKSNEPDEGGMLSRWLEKQTPVERGVLMVYGSGPRPLDIVRARLPDVAVMSVPQLKRCLLRYLAIGWSGTVPADCRHSVIVVPLNYVGLLWGWPDKFLDRMAAVDSPVFVAGPYGGDAAGGVNTAAQLAELPKNYSGGIWTEEIETVAPLVRAKP